MLPYYFPQLSLDWQAGSIVDLSSVVDQSTSLVFGFHECRMPRTFVTREHGGFPEDRSIRLLIETTCRTCNLIELITDL
jgi:hypothetical protein